MRHFTKYPSNYVGAASETSGAAMRRKKREFEQKAQEGTNLVVSDGEWEVYIPENWEAAIKLASLYSDEKALWCTSAKDTDYYYRAYSSRGPLYIIVNRGTGEKYQIHFETNSFFDAKDHNVGKEWFYDLCAEHPAIADYFSV
jgi:hypothetical protein